MPCLYCGIVWQSGDGQGSIFGWIRQFTPINHPHLPGSLFVFWGAGSSHLSTVTMLLFCRIYCRCPCSHIQHPVVPLTYSDAFQESAQQYQYNVNWSRSNTQTSQTLRRTSPVLLSTSRCSQTPLKLSKVLSDSARGAHESTCSYGGGFWMLRDLTYRIVKFWRS